MRRVLSILSLGFIAACSGDGCSCTQATPGGFPSAERTNNVVQVRVTPSALTQIESDPAALFGSFLGTDDGTFPLPATCGGDPEVCCDNGQPIDPCGPINLDLVPQAGDAPRLEINPTNGGNHLQVITRMRIKSASDIPISTNGQDCTVSIDTTDSGNQSVAIVIDLDLAVDATTNTTELANINVNINDLANGDFSIGGGALCVIANVILKGTIRRQLESTLEDTLANTLSELSCKSCPSGDVADCGEFADACDAQVCMRQGSCLQELGLAGRIIADQAFAGFSTGQLGALDIYEVAGGYSEMSNGGISMGVLAGMLPAGTPRDRCGPASGAKPAQPNIPRSPFFSGNTRPDTGAPFGIGIGIHQYNLDLFSWSAYESGLLCLNIGPTTSELLSAETFSLIMPSLLGLAHNQNAPVILGLRPQSPPNFTLGLGTLLDNGDIDDPLINLSFPALEIDFMSMIDDQWIRIMTLVADVNLPINLEVNADGGLSPAIGADMAFTNVSVKNSDALEESPEKLAESFPLILDLALPMLAGNISFDLPLLGSLKLSVQDNGITSVEDKSMLAIFADLTVAPQPFQRQARVETTAAIGELRIPDASAFSAPGAFSATRPTIVLELGGNTSDRANADNLEWSYRLNGGMWSTFSKQRQRTIARDSLWLQGMHTVEVRARQIGAPNTIDLSPAVIQVPIDTVPPRLKVLASALGGPFVQVSDYVDNTHVVVEIRDHSGTWKSVGPLNEKGMVAIDPADIDGTIDELEVRARDSSGNITTNTTDISSYGGEFGFHGSGNGNGCNCQSSGPTQGGIALAILVFLALATTRKRRNSLTLARMFRSFCSMGALVLVVALSQMATACSCGSESAPCGKNDCMEGEVERGPTGRWMSMAANADRVVIASYDSTLGDLVLADVVDNELRYVAVDGIPDLDATFAPSTYRHGISQAGPDVGAWATVALGDDGAHLAYQDRDAKTLRYARQQDDGFALLEIDDSGLETGMFTSIEIRGGAPTIAYMVTGVSDADGRMLAQLKYAAATTAQPTASSDFEISVIDEQPISCGGLCADGLSCVVADPDIGEACTAPTADCSETCADDQACVSGSCLAVIPAKSVYDLPSGTGLFNNLISLADGRAVVIFYRKTTGDLMAATLDGSSWTISELDAAGESDTGTSASAVLGTDGLIHIAYQDAIGDQVKYLAWDGTSVTIGPEIVDDGVRDGETRTHPVGGGLAIHARGSELIMVYQDGLNSSQVISRGTTGSWARTESPSTSILVGFYNVIATGLGTTWAASYTYDRSQRVSGEIELITVP